MIRPLVQYAIEPQHGVKTRIGLCAVFPGWSFGRIERIVRHHGFADAAQFEHSIDVFIKRLSAEKLSSFAKIGFAGRKAEFVQHGDHSARCLRHGSILDKQGSPDCIRLVAFVEREIFGGLNSRRPE
jgi:hypothetical protein